MKDYTVTAGYGVVKGVPYINGKPAKKCPDKGCLLCRGAMSECFIEWLCPECGAHLSKSGICLNACHLSAASFSRFQSNLARLSRSGS